MGDEDVGLKLKLERTRRRLRQRDVAAGARLSPTLLSDLENGWRQPTPEQLQRICRVLGIDPGDLIRESSGPTKHEASREEGIEIPDPPGLDRGARQ